MPLHQCMRNLAWLLTGEFNQGLQEPRRVDGGVGTPWAGFPWGASGLSASLPRWPAWAGLGWARLLSSCCGELCFSPWQSIPLHLHVNSPDCGGGVEEEDGGGGWYNPPPSEVCLFTSLYCWSKCAEWPRHGVWGQIWTEWHLPFKRSHSPSCLQDLTPCVAAITSQVWLEWWCSVWAEAYVVHLGLNTVSCSIWCLENTCKGKNNWCNFCSRAIC